MAPRSKQQISVLKAEKRNLIMSAGLKVFSEYGYQAASIASIAKEAGISKGLMYTYFTSKEDLLRTIVLEAMQEMFDVSLKAITEHPAENEFELMIRANFKWIRDNVEFSKIYFGLMTQSSVIDLFKAEMFVLVEPLFKSISSYFEYRKYENPMVETRYFVSMLDGVFMNYIVDPQTYPLSEVEKKIIDQYIN